MAEERKYLVTQTETFEVYAESADDAIEKLTGMESDEQNECYVETTARFAEVIG